MKKQIVKSIVVAGFLVLLGAVSAYSQVHSRMIANIPFDFLVKSQKFSAGMYVITSVNPASGQTLLLFKKNDGTSNGAIVNLNSMNIERKYAGLSSVLIFNRYGSTYFLSEIRNDKENFGAQAPKTKQERNLAKHVTETKREGVALSIQR